MTLAIAPPFINYVQFENLHLRGARGKKSKIAYGPVIRAVACRARGPRLYLIFFQMFFVSSDIRWKEKPEIMLN